MVRKFSILIVIIVILFVFSGCPEFYTFNLFDGLDYVKLPSAEELSKKSTDEGLDYLDELIGSDSFIDKISEDPEAEEVVNDYLEGIYLNPAATEEQQVQAAVLAADFALQVNGSDELVDNVFNALASIQGMADGGDAAADQDAVQAILKQIMPASVTEAATPAEQEEAFTQMVTGLLEAAEIYETLGNTLISDPNAGNVDVTGGTLVNAAVAGMLDVVVSSLVEPAYQSDPADAAGVLWEVYQAGLNGETDLSGVEGFDETAQLNQNVTELPYLQNIATTAGIDAAVLFGESA